MAKESMNEISSERDVEKLFSSIPKIFAGKESEANWEQRDSMIKKLHKLVNSDCVSDYKDMIVKEFHEVTSDIIKNIHSLRTSVAIEGLSLIEDISNVIGDSLDLYMIEIILLNLLKSSSITKKMISAKSAQVTDTFLTNINFHSKTVNILCKSINEKNVQVRQVSALHIKTILNIHGSKEHVKNAIERTEIGQLLQQFLKKGLVDASPTVREACRQTYTAYLKHFPDQAEKLCQLMDPQTQKQLQKITPNNTTVTKLLKPYPSQISKPSKPVFATPSNLSRSATPTTSTTPTKTEPSTTTSNSVSNNKPLITNNTTNITAKPINSRSNSMSSVTFQTPTTLKAFKKPSLTKSLSAHSIDQKTKYTNNTNIQPVKPKPLPIPTTISPEAKINRTIQNKIARLSHISNVSAPSTSIAHKLNIIQSATMASNSRRTQSEFHHQSAVAAASLLHMLRSRDTQMKCKAIHSLAEKLKSTAYHPSHTSIILPPGIPSKIDMLPIFMDMLSGKDLDIEVYQTLMSWECLAGIFVYILSFNYYCSTLVIAAVQQSSHQQQQQQQHSKKDMEIMQLYAQGLLRVKMFLKRNDPDLAQRLLSILSSIQQQGVQDSTLLDTSVKRDISLHPSYKTSLKYGFLAWMDEIVCDYIGLPEDEDKDMLLEGSEWLNVSLQQESASAGQWFDVNDHVRSYIVFVMDWIGAIGEKKQGSGEDTEEIYTILRQMVGHLKMANERVFEEEMKKTSHNTAIHNQRALNLSTLQDQDAEENKSVSSDPNILLSPVAANISSERPLLVEWEMMNIDQLDDTEDTTGMTQKISDIDLDTLPAEYSSQKKNNVVADLAIMKTDIEKRLVAEKKKEEGQRVSEEEVMLSIKPIDSTPTLPYFHKKLLARPALSPSSSNKTNSESEEGGVYRGSQAKKRRPNQEDSHDHHVPFNDENIVFLRKAIQQLNQDTTTKKLENATLFEIQKISAETPVLLEPKNAEVQVQNRKFWSTQIRLLEGHKNNNDEKNYIVPLFIGLISGLTESLKGNFEVSIKQQVIQCIHHLVTNQSKLLAKIETTGQRYYNVVYQLSEPLLVSAIHVYSGISSGADETLKTLLRIYTPDFAILLLWKLAKKYSTIETDAATTRGHPLSSIFSHISRIAPNTTCKTLERSLKDGAADCLVKGYDHANQSVRKSCVLASVGVHKVLGETYIRTYLSALRTEQLSLLQHYISKDQL